MGRPACLSFFFFYITRLIPWNACAYLRAPARTRSSWILPRFEREGRRTAAKEFATTTKFHSLSLWCCVWALAPPAESREQRTPLPQLQRRHKQDQTEWDSPVRLSFSSSPGRPCLTLYPFWKRSPQDFFRLHVSGSVSKLALLSVRRYTSSRGGIIFFPLKNSVSLKNSLFSLPRLGIKNETAGGGREKIKAQDFRRTFRKWREIIQSQSGKNEVFVAYFLIFPRSVWEKASAAE